MKEEFTLTIYTEDQMGLMNKISIMFLRHKITLKSINISCCEIDKMYRFTIVVRESFEKIKNIVHQIEKIIDVFRCFCNRNQEIICSQMVLYKIVTATIIKEERISFLLNESNAKILFSEENYSVFKVTGQDFEIDNLTIEISQYGPVEFIKSPRIAFIKSSQSFQKELLDMQ
jgi:acetolactate synthase-1/3 small subunit